MGLTLPPTTRQNLLVARQRLEEVQKLAEVAVAKALPNSAVTDLKVGEGCSAIFHSSDTTLYSIQGSGMCMSESRLSVVMSASLPREPCSPAEFGPDA